MELIKMIQGVEALYQQIGESIQEAIPEEWSTARIEATFYSESILYIAEYTRQADGKLRSFATTKTGRRALLELRQKFKEAGQRVWGKALFEMQSNGKFNLKFSYEDCDENGDTRFDEEEELRRAAERRNRLTAE